MAAGFLGQMYLKGVGVDQNFDAAMSLFELGKVVDQFLYL